MVPLEEIRAMNRKAAEREMDKHERELPEWPEDRKLPYAYCDPYGRRSMRLPLYLTAGSVLKRARA